jgi:hypothetical protein
MEPNDSERRKEYEEKSISAHNIPQTSIFPVYKFAFKSEAIFSRKKYIQQGRMRMLKSPRHRLNLDREKKTIDTIGAGFLLSIFFYFYLKALLSFDFNARINRSSQQRKAHVITIENNKVK